MPGDNSKYLIPQNQRTKEQQSQIARMGGIASGKARRKKKTMQQLAKMMLESETNKKNVRSVKGLCKEIEDEDITVMASMIAGQARSAMKGNALSFQVLTELAEKEQEKENTSFYIPAKDIAKSFVDLNRDIDNPDYSEFWLRGGRGSTKSTYIGEKTIELMKNNPNYCALVMREVGNTLKDSVYMQIKWAIDHLGLTSQFKFTVSPMEITLKETGQKIYFRGGDDPQKIKSIRPPEGMYIAIRWFEEADQLKGMKEIRNINQSTIRGGDRYYTFFSYNVPISNTHWINVEASSGKPDRIVHDSDYRDVPKQWLGKQFFDDAEWLKQINPKAYEHEYLGIPVGQGLEVFDNLEIREITDNEIASFDKVLYGVDWGWYPDPFHFGGCYYDSARMTLYIFDEYRCNKKSNKDTANVLLNEKGLTRYDIVTCDSAEQKSVEEYRTYGINARAAEKGPDSVRFGMKWLQSLLKIVIDPIKCPNTKEEFSKYQYETTPEGEPISAYPDLDNHSIDCIRYATEQIWKKRGGARYGR